MAFDFDTEYPSFFSFVQWGENRSDDDYFMIKYLKMNYSRLYFWTFAQGEKKTKTQAKKP